MSEEFFDVAEFWLPSDFIYDDLLLEDERRRKALATAPPPPVAAKSFLSAGLVDGLASNLVLEGNGDGCLAGLTQKMTNSFILDGGKERNASAAVEPAVKHGDADGTPQVTLCGWSASKKEVPSGPSLAWLPPLSKEEQQLLGEPWSVLSEVAGQVMRFKLRDLVHCRDLYQRGLLGSDKKPSPVAPAPGMNAGNATGCYATALPTVQQLREAQFLRLKQLQLMKQQQQLQLQKEQWGKQHRANGGGGYGEGRCGRPLGLSTPSWPPLQKQRQHAIATSGDGMRAVFLNNAKKQCAGTGVFIPRPSGGKVNEPPRKKTVRSTVLVPTRVVQALNLNLEELDAQSRFSMDHAAFISRSNALPHLKAKQQLHPQKAVTAHDLRLPQEWSY